MVDLAQKKRRALRHLVGLGIAVARRPALEHVGDVDVLAALESDRGEHVVEQLPRLADERVAEPVLLCARRLADQHPLRVLIAHAEYGLRARLVQAARGASGHRLFQLDPPGLRTLELDRAVT